MDRVLDFILGFLQPKYIGSIVRTILAAVAGFLAAKGMSDAGDLLNGMSEQIAALIFAIVQAWSLKQKSKI